LPVRAALVVEDRRCTSSVATAMAGTAFWLAVAVVLAACSSPTPRTQPRLATGGSGSVGSAGSAGSAAAVSGLITDDECRARGGTVVTEETYAHLRRANPDAPVTPFRVCRIPSAKNGAACQGDGDCAGGRCFCTGALARPDPENDPALRQLDHTPATGRCSDEALPDGSWFCLVEGGTVRLNGIIVD
jgi:hypothetical protein